MSKTYTGGYRLVSLAFIDLALAVTAVSVSGLGDALGVKSKKRVVLTDIVVSGENKEDVTVQVKKDGDNYVIENVYGYDLSIDASGNVTSSKHGATVDPATLYGKFVRIIDAPETSTLTEDQIELFKGGIFVNGVVNTYFKNPIFTPAIEKGSLLIGVVITRTIASDNVLISPYNIDSNGLLTIVQAQGVNIDAYKGNVSLNDKVFPVYPTDQTNKTYALKLVNGSLMWVEENA